MSWSLRLIGKPDAVAAALEKYSEGLTGQSKVEYDDAKPHLVGLVHQHFAEPGTSYVLPILDLEASGSGSAKDGKQMQRTCCVSLKTMWGTLVALMVASVLFLASNKAQAAAPLCECGPGCCCDGCTCGPLITALADCRGGRCSTCSTCPSCSRSSTATAAGPRVYFVGVKPRRIPGATVRYRAEGAYERPHVTVRHRGRRTVLYGKPGPKLIQAAIRQCAKPYPRMVSVEASEEKPPAAVITPLVPLPGTVTAWVWTGRRWELQFVPAAPVVPIYVAPSAVAYTGPAVGLTIRFGSGGHHHGRHR